MLYVVVARGGLYYTKVGVPYRWRSLFPYLLLLDVVPHLLVGRGSLEGNLLSYILQTKLFLRLFVNTYPFSSGFLESYI